LYATVLLCPTISIRSQAVFNVVDMIAEVSGLADVLYVMSASFVNFFFTIRMLHSFLAYHTGKVTLKED
jgi:nicotinamide riboside transporter PnuC